MAIASHPPQLSIAGYAKTHRHNFTINGKYASQVTLNCSFYNESSEKFTVLIRTFPNHIRPDYVIQVAKGSKKMPKIVQSRFHLKLLKHWWCAIFLSKKSPHWPYCTYFSISHSDNSQINPFFTLKKEIASSEIKFHCHITKPNQFAGFFAELK